MEISKIQKNTGQAKKKITELDYFSKNSLKYYSQYYEHLSSPVVLISADFVIQYLNRAAEEFYSTTGKNCIGKRCYDEFTCTLFEISGACPVSEVISKGEPMEMKVPNHLGREDCHLNAFPLKDHNGEFNLICIEDFSGVVTVKTQAVELESRINKIVELAVDAIFILGDDFNIEFANTSAVMMIDEPIVDLIGTDFRDFLNNEKVIEFLEEIYRGNIMSESVCYYSEESVLFGKENLNFVEMCITRTRETEGHGTMYVYLKNITEEKKLQNDLVKANEFMENLINRSADAIITADMKGNIIIFNESAEKFLGYKAEEAISNLHITKVYPPGIAKEIMVNLRSEDYGGVGKMEAIEATTLSNDGEEIPCNLSAALIYDKDGKEVASVGIFSDLRERKRMQKDLEETQMKLLQSEKVSSLGKLAAGIAHEINNPLGGIMIFANMLLEDLGENDEIKDDLKRIVSEASRCKNIVKGLLDYSRQTDSKMVLTDLNNLIEQGISLLENQAIFHNIKVIKEYDKNLPMVKCDSARLSQVFINIILNAVDAMEQKGEFTIKTGYNQEKNNAIIKFTDTGCGIPEEIQLKIFDPFFTTKEIGKGTGLGLSMSYGIIKDHGGTINIESRIKEGTTFNIELPIKD